MKTNYPSQYGCIIKMCPGAHEYWYHGWMLCRGSGLSDPNPDCAPTEKDWALCKEYLDEHKERLLDARKDAPYDQQVFEDMIFDYFGDHSGDDGWPGEDGEYAEVYKDSIDYDPDDNVWLAYGLFKSTGTWVEFTGNVDGFVEMETL